MHVHFPLASANVLASQPMALPVLKPSQKPYLRVVSMYKMDRRWSSCASSLSQRLRWPYMAAQLKTVLPARIASKAQASSHVSI